MSIKNFIKKKCKPILHVYVYLKLWLIDTYMKRNGYVFCFEGIKSLFYLPYIRTDGIQIQIYGKKNYYEREMLDFIITQWNNGIIRKSIKEEAILDIGSNIGNHTLYFLIEHDAKFSYCFEPAKDTFQILKRNIEVNHLEKRTALYNSGVGSTMGSANISSQRNRNTAYTKISMNENGVVRVVSIDGLGIKEKIGFVKIDVEGFELEVIRGMQKTLQENKPYVMVEIWNDNYNEIIMMMENMGYQYQCLGKRNNQGDYLFYQK